MPIATLHLVGITAGLFTSVSLLPQVIKIVKEKEAKDVSMGMLIFLITGLALWTLYGFMIHDIPIIATNSFSIILNFVLIVLRIKYACKKTG